MAGRRTSSLLKRRVVVWTSIREMVCSWLERSADGVVMAGAFCRRSWSWLEQSEPVVIVVERPRSWAVDSGPTVVVSESVWPHEADRYPGPA